VRAPACLHLVFSRLTHRRGNQTRAQHVRCFSFISSAGCSSLPIRRRPHTENRFVSLYVLWWVYVIIFINLTVYSNVVYHYDIPSSFIVVIRHHSAAVICIVNLLHDNKLLICCVGSETDYPPNRIWLRLLLTTVVTLVPTYNLRPSYYYMYIGIFLLQI